VRQRRISSRGGQEPLAENLEASELYI